MRFPDAASLDLVVSPDSFRRSGDAPEGGATGRNLLVLVDGDPVGEARFEMDPPKLVTKTPGTAWLYLVIADQRLRRRGLGTRIIDHLETLAAAAGAARSEVGIFEYNTRSLRFFGALGYREFARLPERAWWDGRLWADVRLIKPLGGAQSLAECAKPGGAGLSSRLDPEEPTS